MSDASATRPVGNSVPGTDEPETQRLLLLQPETNPTAHEALAAAADYPFEPRARTWSRVNAWWLAEASWLACDGNEQRVQGVLQERAGLDSWLVRAGDVDVYVATRETFAILAFRTPMVSRWRDLFDEDRFTPMRWEAGHVHKGLGRAFAAARPALDRVLDRLGPTCPVWLTGHGAAAGVATLAAYHYRLRVAGLYTFGSPRVGNGVFAGLFGPAFQERSIRYVHDHDVVTHVPPKPFALPHGLFTHVDHLRWINREGQVGSTQPTIPHFLTDVFGRANVLLDLIDPTSPSLPAIPAALADHAPIHYARHCWSDLVRYVPRDRATS